LLNGPFGLVSGCTSSHHKVHPSVGSDSPIALPCLRLYAKLRPMRDVEHHSFQRHRLWCLNVIRGHRADRSNRGFRGCHSVRSLQAPGHFRFERAVVVARFPLSLLHCPANGRRRQPYPPGWSTCNAPTVLRWQFGQGRCAPDERGQRNVERVPDPKVVH